MQRLIKELKWIALVLVAGICYLIFTAATGLGIPCPFYMITGYLCSGCGATRMFISIAKLDFQAAFQHNKVLFITLPILLAVWIFERVCYIKTGKSRLHLISKIILCIEAFLLIIYGVIRNIG